MRKALGPILHALARQKAWRIMEGHVLPCVDDLAPARAQARVMLRPDPGISATLPLRFIFFLLWCDDAIRGLGTRGTSRSKRRQACAGGRSRG